MISAVFYIFCERGWDEFTLEGFCPLDGGQLAPVVERDAPVYVHIFPIYLDISNDGNLLINSYNT